MSFRGVVQWSCISGHSEGQSDHDQSAKNRFNLCRSQTVTPALVVIANGHCYIATYCETGRLKTINRIADRSLFGNFTSKFHVTKGIISKLKWTNHSIRYALYTEAEGVVGVILSGAHQYSRSHQLSMPNWHVHTIWCSWFIFKQNSWNHEVDSNQLESQRQKQVELKHSNNAATNWKENFARYQPFSLFRFVIADEVWLQRHSKIEWTLYILLDLFTIPKPNCCLASPKTLIRNKFGAQMTFCRNSMCCKEWRN